MSALLVSIQCRSVEFALVVTSFQFALNILHVVNANSVTLRFAVMLLERCLP
jgi:hypothetical protein